MRLVAKHAEVGYQTPGERPGCRNCAHFEVTRHDSPVIAPRTACTRHSLEVTSGGICRDHKLQRRQDEGQLAFLARQRDLLEQQTVELADNRRIPSVGEMHQGKLMTPARHARMLAEQLIRNEEASGDPELLRVAAFRRRALRTAPHHGETQA